MPPANRKSPRLRGYDYRLNGDYFITICTQNFIPCLCGITVSGETRLTLQGEICKKWIEKLPQHYKDITASPFCIMPNHIHLILSVRHPIGEDTAESIQKYPKLYDYIGWMKYFITKEINETTGFEEKTFFQQSFFDHIIRDYVDYSTISDYILTNAKQWKQDCYHPDNLDNLLKKQ